MRVGHRIIEIKGQSVVAVAHEKIVNMLATAVGEVSGDHQHASHGCRRGEWRSSTCWPRLSARSVSIMLHRHHVSNLVSTCKRSLHPVSAVSLVVIAVADSHEDDANIDLSIAHWSRDASLHLVIASCSWT